MILILNNSASESEITQLETWLQKFNVQVSPIVGEGTTILGLVGDTSALDTDTIQRNPIVDRIVKVQEPYKLANRKMHPENSIITIGGKVQIGGNKIVVMAGPCSVESQEQLLENAFAVKAAGATVLRGGAWKPRSSPYAFQGHKELGLDYLVEARRQTGLPIITEITNPSHVELFLGRCDCFQVGARNMQNFELLKELGQTNIPVLLKRGLANSIDELLMSAEYICAGGNSNVILCERGIRTFETASRNTLDVSAVPVLKRRSHLPVVIDPSHAAGIYWMVEPLAMAGIAAGADGLIIEVHNNPSQALSDGAQSLTYELFAQTMDKVRAIAGALGRSL